MSRKVRYVVREEGCHPRPFRVIDTKKRSIILDSASRETAQTIADGMNADDAPPWHVRLLRALASFATVARTRVAAFKLRH